MNTLQIKAGKTSLDNVVYINTLEVFYQICSRFFIIDAECGTLLLPLGGVIYVRLDRKYLICRRKSDFPLKSIGFNFDESQDIEMMHYYGNPDHGDLIIRIWLRNNSKYKNINFPDYLDILDPNQLQLQELNIEVSLDKNNSLFGINIGKHFNSKMFYSDIYSIRNNELRICAYSYIKHFLFSNQHLDKIAHIIDDNKVDKMLKDILKIILTNDIESSINFLDALYFTLDEFKNSNETDICEYILRSDFLVKNLEIGVGEISPNIIFHSLNFPSLRELL